mgnify:CR=1 FL=1
MKFADIVILFICAMLFVYLTFDYVYIHKIKKNNNINKNVLQENVLQENVLPENVLPENVLNLDHMSICDNEIDNIINTQLQLATIVSF